MYNELNNNDEREGVRRLKVKKKDWREFSKGLMIASCLAILAAAWGFLYQDFFLASTQWLLIAAVLAAFGLYARIES